jgi:hypothetical protein
MSNPWKVNLKKTGLIEQRLNEETVSITDLEKKQVSLKIETEQIKTKIDIYKNRQESKLVDSIYNKQNRNN